MWYFYQIVYAPIDKQMMTVWYINILNNVETNTLAWIFFPYQLEIPWGYL